MSYEKTNILIRKRPRIFTLINCLMALSMNRIPNSGDIPPIDDNRERHEKLHIVLEDKIAPSSSGGVPEGSEIPDD